MELRDTTPTVVCVRAIELAQDQELSPDDRKKIDSNQEKGEAGITRK